MGQKHLKIERFQHVSFKECAWIASSNVKTLQQQESDIWHMLRASEFVKISMRVKISKNMQADESLTWTKVTSCLGLELLRLMRGNDRQHFPDRRQRGCDSLVQQSNGKSSS
jgi:hypothetical protein